MPRAAWGGTLAHLGLAVFAIGVAGLSLWKSEEVVFMNKGDTVKIAGFDVRLTEVENIDGPNYIAERAEFFASKAGRRGKTMIAERRFYPVRGMQTTEAAITPHRAGDLYITIGEAQAGKGWPVRLYFNPFVGCLWWGAAIVVLGGVFSISDRGRKPARARREIETAAGALAQA
jgi:cytochrome c-type biogenesis protein CcmF